LDFKIMDFKIISNILGLNRLESKLERLDQIKKSLSSLKVRIDDLSNDYQKNLHQHKVRKSGEDNEEILKSIDSRWDSFMSHYSKELSGVYTEKKTLEKEMESILSNPKVSQVIEKAEKELKEFNLLKKTFKFGFMSLEEFSKARKAKIKYSDIIVLNEKGQLLLLKRSMFEDTHKGAWVIPGGHVDPGEDFETAAKRELVEESGLSVTKMKEVGIHKDSFVEIHYFQTEVNSLEKPVVLEFLETRDYRWVDLDQVDEYEMVFNMKKNVMEILGIKPNKAKIIKSMETICKAYLDGHVSIDVIKKAQTKAQTDKISTVMSEFKAGDLVTSSGAKVTDKKQAIAIALSEAGLKKAEESKVPAKEEKSKGGWKEHLADMIVEHERLVKVFSDIKNPSDTVKKELETQKKELEKYRKELKELEKSELATLEKAFDSGLISEDIIQKARTGVYADNSVNRKLKRVGQKYGSDKKEEAPSSGSDKKKEEPEKSTSKTPLADQAKEASGSALEVAAKEAKDSEVRSAAHQELDRREKEEKVQEESTEAPKGEKKAEESKEGATDDTTAEGLKEKLRELRNADIDYSDTKAMDENIQQINSIMKELKALEQKAQSSRRESTEGLRKGFKNFNEGGKFNLGKARNFYDKGSADSETNLSQNFMQKKALDMYIEDGYEAVREYLTNGEVKEDTLDLQEGFQFNVNNDTMKTATDAISAFIKGNKITENISLNRRVWGDAEEFFSSLNVGDEYEDKSFSSTSLKEITHFGKFNIEILAKSGSNVANVGNPGELEYLIDKGAKFKVLEKQEKGIIVELL